MTKQVSIPSKRWSYYGLQQIQPSRFGHILLYGVEVAKIEPAGNNRRKGCQKPNIRNIDGLDEITLIQGPVRGE
jgi:hypothetical protein